MVLTGGIGTLIGPILGAMVFILIQEVLSSYTEHWMIFTGAVFVLMVIRSDGAHRRHRHAHRPDPRRDGLHPHPGSALQLHRALDDLHRRRVRPDGDLPARRAGGHGPAAGDARVTILEPRGLGRTFGALRAVADVSLRVDAGELRALIGPNGAGKTT